MSCKSHHQTNPAHAHRDHSKITARASLVALLLTSSFSLAQDDNDATKLPPFNKLPLCTDPISTYTCLNQDPTLTEAWEHLESDDTQPSRKESADRDKGSRWDD